VPHQYRVFAQRRREFRPAPRLMPGEDEIRARRQNGEAEPDQLPRHCFASYNDPGAAFVTDFDEFQKCADIRMRYLGVATPASATVCVTRLAGPDFMIEIEAVAIVNF